MVYVVIIVVIVLILVRYDKSVKEKWAKEDRELEKLNKDVTFEGTNVIENIIELDENRKLFKLCRCKYCNPSKIYKYSDILDFELLEDNNTIETNAGIGKAVAGGLLFGGVGAIVGGSTAKRKSKKVVNSIRIKITLNNTQNPVIYIDLLKDQLKTDSLEFKNITEIAQKLISVLNIIKNISQKENDSFEEIIKYKELLDNGVISQEEFETKKKELLKI